LVVSTQVLVNRRKCTQDEKQALSLHPHTPFLDSNEAPSGPVTIIS
jgi:hypothetical protein